jgi:type IV pilus assembly protein PilN
MNFNINLATRVYVDFKKVNICCLIVAAILSFWLLFSLYTYIDNASKIQKFSEYKAKLSQGTETKKVSASDYTAFLAGVKQVNSILYKRSYDWLSLLSNLERLVPEGVALRGLEPSEKGAVLKLTGSARNFSGVRKFIENLESSKVFAEVYLTDQTTTKEGSQKGLNFTVTCKVSAS